MLRCNVDILRTGAACDNDVDLVGTGDAPHCIGIGTTGSTLNVDKMLGKVTDGKARQLPQPLLDVTLGEASVIQRLRMVNTEYQQYVVAAVRRRHIGRYHAQDF